MEATRVLAHMEGKQLQGLPVSCCLLNELKVVSAVHSQDADEVSASRANHHSRESDELQPFKLAQGQLVASV